MNTKTKDQAYVRFLNDVRTGLTSEPKYLSSKYIYDRQGDAIFQEIMAMPEYYLTDAEYEVFTKNTEAILSRFYESGTEFNLVELGAGDGKKTKVLLEALLYKSIDFCYQPIDISGNALRLLETDLKDLYPNLNVMPKEGEYFEVLHSLRTNSKKPKVIMMLGSNLGNLEHKNAIDFLQKIALAMGEKDIFFIGLDQKKDPQTILNAYNDPHGITERFNKNILTRINGELGGHFDIDKFIHWESYDPETGTAKSYLLSTTNQSVYIDDLQLNINFDAWESIHVEISQKYDDAIVNWLAEEAGLKVDQSFSDSRDYFKNYILLKA